MDFNGITAFVDFCEAEDVTELATAMMVLTDSPDDYGLAGWVVDHVGFVVEYLASRQRLRDMPEEPVNGLDPVWTEVQYVGYGEEELDVGD